MQEEIQNFFCKEMQQFQEKINIIISKHSNKNDGFENVFSEIDVLKREIRQKNLCGVCSACLYFKTKQVELKNIEEEKIVGALQQIESFVKKPINNGEIIKVKELEKKQKKLEHERRRSAPKNRKFIDNELAELDKQLFEIKYQKVII